MDDELDGALQDDQLLEEIRLATDLMIAASNVDRFLTRDEIDRVLGVAPSPTDADR